MTTPHRSSTKSQRRQVRTVAGAQRDWSQRCAGLFEDLRKPARGMVAKAYGSALSEEEVEDVYAAAWAATLGALRDRGGEMSDEELRAYVLTAVASHASKELRRRTRKPAGSLDAAHEQVVSDVHLPLPDEAAIGSESARIARDLLTSLPARRRAVMLLRYGWGLSPTEICALVSGLSARAYRKEITKGVDQLIDRLKQVESGEWCRSREPLLRDYVAGVADEDVRRQVEQHIGHCRACSEFAGKLTGHLHDLGAGVALAGVASVIGDSKLRPVDRLVELVDGGRATVSNAAERGEAMLGSWVYSGGGRGAGAAGAGVVAKFAAGGAGKAALACIGTGAAATACVAAGVVPGVSLSGFDRSSPKPDRTAPIERSARNDPKPTIRPVAPSVVELGDAIASSSVVQEAPAEPPEQSSSEGEKESSSESVQPQAESEAAATPAAAEFDPVATSETEAPPVAVEPAPPPSSGDSGSGADTGVAQQEFGP